ncbi:phasin family protein [Qipengyuania sp. GH1]|uniref:phasin family protein n=1 Tax=Qipengyuania aestuarii TaxID=2867241 RepID=UPI001C88644D|nr:phasin family protein [Qipengyuania aestuarii]MBX7536195.1 phasin family protein [Qipengyuania aestuarii]
MAEDQDKSAAATEKAYNDAVDKAVTANAKTVGKTMEAKSSGPVEVDAVAKAVAAPASSTSGQTKTRPADAPKTLSKKKASSRKSGSKKAVKPSAPETSPPSITKLKETIMANAKPEKTADYAATAKDMADEMQSRAKAAYEKSTEMTKEAVEFQKGNLEALVESGKILASGMQDMGRAYVEEAKSAADTVQGDVKSMAAVKSPTDLFQLQGEIARRNFDAMVSTASKNTETMLKLVNDAFAPLSNRMSLAAEKVRTAA